MGFRSQAVSSPLSVVRCQLSVVSCQLVVLLVVSCRSPVLSRSFVIRFANHQSPVTSRQVARYQPPSHKSPVTLTGQQSRHQARYHLLTFPISHFLTFSPSHLPTFSLSHVLTFPHRRKQTGSSPFRRAPAFRGGPPHAGAARLGAPAASRGSFFVWRPPRASPVPGRASSPEI